GDKLVLMIKQSTGDFGDLSSPEEPALSEAEIAARMEQQRREWDQAKLMLGELPDTLKMRIAINIPGTLENGATSNFKEVTPNQLALEISGKQMLNVLDELFKDDATARAI